MDIYGNKQVGQTKKNQMSQGKDSKNGISDRTSIIKNVVLQKNVLTGTEIKLGR